MDVRQTWKDLQGNINFGQFEEALENVDSLIGWIEKGGFKPEGFSLNITGLHYLKDFLQTAIDNG